MTNMSSTIAVYGLSMVPTAYAQSGPQIQYDFSRVVLRIRQAGFVESTSRRIQ
jgi:hypothetical protein